MYSEGMRRDSQRKFRRKTEKLKRRNFLPTLLMTIFLWVGLGITIYFSDPYSFGIVPLFFILAFFAVFFTTTILTENKRRGLIITIVIISFLILRYLGVGNIINLLLIAGLAVATEIYLAK